MKKTIILGSTNLTVTATAFGALPIEDCLHCGHCASRCPYGLDTPTLLRKNYEDYKKIIAGTEPNP